MPNPPMRMVAPSWTSASASATEPITLSSMASYGGWCDGRPSRAIAERARAALAQRRGQGRELGDEGAGLGRIDDVLDHECLGTAKRRSQRAHPLLYLRTLGFRVGRGFDIRLVGDLETAFDRQRAPLGARPGIAKAEAARMLVTAGGDAEGLADDHGTPGHRRLRYRGRRPHADPHDPLDLGIEPDLEAGHADEAQHRQAKQLGNTEQPDELLVGSAIPGAAIVIRIACEHDHRPAVDAGEPRGQGLAPAATDLEEGSRVDESLDDAADLVDLARVLGDHVAQFRLVGARFAAVLRPRRQFMHRTRQVG